MVLMTISVKVNMFIAHVISEEAAVCCPLPSTDCDGRRDKECVWSRRQVLKT